MPAVIRSKTYCFPISYVNTQILQYTIILPFGGGGEGREIWSLTPREKQAESFQD
jgi:hypothetical protein